MASQAPPLAILHHLITLDATLSHTFHLLTKPILLHSFLILKYSVHFRLSFLVSLSLILCPLHFSFLISFLLGLLLNLSLVGLVKILFHRPRPHYNPNISPAISADNFSFRNGHNSLVFFVATFLCLYIVVIERFTINLGIGSFLEKWIKGTDEERVSIGKVNLRVWMWAVVIVISRILLVRHFVLDLFAGACLGVLEALIVFQFLRF